MTFKAQLAADLAAFFHIDEFAETVTYNGNTIIAVPEIGESNAKGNTFDTGGKSDQAYFWVKVADVATPSPGDAIEFAGTTWIVSRAVESDGAAHRLECAANESPFSMR